jgi:hypothetical protein
MVRCTDFGRVWISGPTSQSGKNRAGAAIRDLACHPIKTSLLEFNANLLMASKQKHLLESHSCDHYCRP